MNIFDFAYDFETESLHHYEKLSKASKNEGIKKILSMLAEEEQKHQKIILKMKSNEKTDYADESFLKNAKDIFIDLKSNNPQIKDDIKQIELYRKALELEKKSEKFYLDKATEAHSPASNEIFIKLALEENKHFLVLENIIELISRTEWWVENAEFDHFDEY